MKFSGRFGARNGAIGFAGGPSKFFRKASDGSLVMKVKAFGGGLAFIFIPVAGSSTEWWKWQPVEEKQCPPTSDCK